MMKTLHNFWGNNLIKEEENKKKSRKDKLRKLIQEAKRSATTHVLGKKQLGFHVTKVLPYKAQTKYN